VGKRGVGVLQESDGDWGKKVSNRREEGEHRGDLPSQWLTQR
jgi:hypothetical protein